MNSRTSFLFAAAFGLTMVAAVGADNPAPAGNIALYLSPDATKPALSQVSAGDAKLADAKPAPDAAKAAQGWHVVSLSGPFTGYVTTKASHKDFSVTPGTPVHVSADENSPVLGLSTNNPLLKISSAGVDFSEVSFPGPVTAYFLTGAAAGTASPTPAVSAPPTHPAAVTAVTAVTAVSATAPTRQADPSDVGHYYYGVLKSRTDQKIAGPVNAEYVLYSSRDQVLALVDLNDVVLPNPVVAYLGKAVKIYGTVYPESHVPFVVIHALTVQTN